MLNTILKTIDNIYFKIIYFLCLAYTILYVEFWFNQLNDPPFELLSMIIIRFTVYTTLFAMLIAAVVLIREKMSMDKLN